MITFHDLLIPSYDKALRTFWNQLARHPQLHLPRTKKKRFAWLEAKIKDLLEVDCARLLTEKQPQEPSMSSAQ
jgi:hypothetical protein